MPTNLSSTPSGSSLEIAFESDADDQRLFHFFGSAEKKRAFSSSAVAVSTLMLSHCYALRHLQTEFPPERDHALTSTQQTQLHQLIADHVQAILSAADELGQQLSPLEQSFHIARVAGSPNGSPNGSPSSFAAGNWQQETQHTLEVARSIDHLLRAMLTTTEAPLSVDLALPQLSVQLSTLRTGLDRLDGLLH